MLNHPGLFAHDFDAMPGTATAFKGIVVVLHA